MALQNYLTIPVVPGIQGLDLRKPLDLIDQLHLPRMTNCVRNAIGEITGRPGLTQLCTGVTNEVRFIQAANIPTAALPPGSGIAFTHDFIIGDTSGTIYSATGGVTSTNPPTALATGYSTPITGLVYHPPNSGMPWVYLASFLKMGKVRAGYSQVAPIGFPAPPTRDNRFRLDEFSGAPDGTFSAIDRIRFPTLGFQTVDATGAGQAGLFTSYGTQHTRPIDTCETASWTNNPGTGGAPSNANDSVDFKQGTASLKLTTAKGAATGTYYNFWAKANAFDMSHFSDGTTLTDDDIIHIWIKTDHPEKLAEFRLYFVIDSSFDTGTLPGTSTTLNVNSYEKSFRPSDFTNAYLVASSTLAAGVTASTNRATDQQLQKSKDRRGSTKLVREQTDLSRSIASQLGPGVGWTEYGVIGMPLARGEFRRIGGDATRTWGTVTGLVLAVQTTDATTGINVWLDDIYVTGGAGLDSSQVGLTPYDFRCTNYDPTTGVEGNPSPIQGAGYQLDSLRQAIVVTPPAYGVSTVRQKVYRRGGTLQNNWYYSGVNGMDGGPYTDILSDAAIVAAGTLATDNDQPVTTVDSTGTAVLAAPITSIFGPYNDILFGCGDKYRKGHLYWTKPTKPDSWPAAYIAEVCSPTEELMHGCVFQGGCFVFSRERQYAVMPNLQNVAIVVTTPTQCQHGLVTRRGLAVGTGAMWFVAKDGVYGTTGGPEQSITEDSLWHLFRGQSRYGYLPIDWAFPDSIQLEVSGNDVWFTYRDTGGSMQTFIYDSVFKYWRHANFGFQISTVHSVQGTTDFGSAFTVFQTPLALALGGTSSGALYSHAGTSDAGLPISSRFTTGAIDAGQPRNDKLFGDLMIDMDRAGNTVTITPYYNSESSSSTPLNISTLTGRQRYYVDTAATQAFNCSIDVAWSTSSTPPVIYKVGPSIIPQADTAEKRVTDWDDLGTPADKYVKGIIFDVDTSGAAKGLNIMGDGAVLASTSVTAAGRQVVEVSFSQFQARLLRIAPTDTVQWKLYAVQWVFDQEPMALTRWESQEVSHNIPGWQVPLFANITIRSTADVTLQLTSFRQDGTSVVKNYPIVSTGGVKTKKFVGFEATKGVLFKYLFTCASPFWLYRPESEVQVQPWGAGQAATVRPFGDDDQDLVRSSVNAEFAAGRSGGAGWTQRPVMSPSGSSGDFTGGQQ